MVWPLGDRREFGYDFKVMADKTGHRSEILYFDRDGNLVRALYKARGTTYLFNEHYPDFSIPSKCVWAVMTSFYRFSQHTAPHPKRALTPERRVVAFPWQQ